MAAVLQVDSLQDSIKTLSAMKNPKQINVRDFIHSLLHYKLQLMIY